MTGDHMFFARSTAIAAGCFFALLVAFPSTSQATVVPIHQIQGTGFLSPLNNTVASTEGVVTVVLPDGYYLQTIFSADDGNPLTSQGLFVYTGAAPAVNIVSGALVRVTGTIEEYRPANQPDQLTITRLKDISDAVVLSTGNPLPSATTLVDADLNDGNSIDWMERYEGMRVRISQLKVTQPVGGLLNEVTGAATLDHVFYGVLPHVVRPAREPGINIMTTFAIPAGKSIPFFDNNPESLRVDSSRLAGTTALSPDVNDVINNLVGVLAYQNGSPTLLALPNASTSVSLGSFTSGLGRGANYEDISLAVYNLDRFFDNLDNPAINEPVLAAQTFQNRLEKTANVVCSYIYGPDVLAVYEVESLATLQALAEKINSTNYCTDKFYTAHLVETNDPDGLDIGLLVSEKLIENNKKKIEILSIEQLESEKTFLNASGSTERLYDRASLLAKIRANSATNNNIDMTLVISDFMSDKNINSSSPGSNGWASIGEYVRKKRAAQALSLAQLIQNRQVADPAEKIILLGNFKAPAFSDGYVDVMGILTGRETAAANIVEYVDSPITSALTNLSTLTEVGTQSLQTPENQNTSIVNGNTQRLEHIVLNENSFNFFRKIWGVPSINSGYGVDLYNDISVPVRASRYEPTLVYLSNDLFALTDANLSLGHPYELVRNGINAAPLNTFFTFFVSTEGPSNMRSGIIDIDIDVAANFINVSDDPAFSIHDCTKTSPTLNRTHFLCPFDNGTTEFVARTLKLELNADTSFDEKTILLTANLTPSISDPNLSNNTVAFSASFTTKTDLTLSLYRGGATEGVSPNETISIAMSVGNLTPVPGLNAVGTFEVTGATPSMISTPDSKCTQITVTGPDKLRITCNFVTITSAYWSNSQQLGYFLLTLPQDYSNPSLQVSAILSTDTTDINTVNNAANLTIPARVDANIETVFTAPSAGFVAKNRPSDYFVTIEHSGPVAPLNPTVEFIVDSVPADIAVIAPVVGGSSYTCLPPESIGIGKSKVLCSGIASVYWDAVFKITATPYRPPGVANGTFSISAKARSSTPDFSMANNDATLTVPANYSTDLVLGLMIFNGIGNPAQVVEPANIVYSVSPGFDLFGGVNYPVNTRIGFSLNAVLSSSQISISKGSNPDVRVPMSCIITPNSPVGQTNITCSDTLVPLLDYVTVVVKTSGSLQNKTLTLTATATNDLVDTNLANNTQVISTQVIGKADLCVSPNDTTSDIYNCGGVNFFLPSRIVAGDKEVFMVNYRNFGPSTARNTKAIFRVGVPASRLSARILEQTFCDAATAINANESEITCNLGDVAANVVYRIEFWVDTTGETNGRNLPYKATFTTDTEDTNLGNNIFTSSVPVAPIVDLSSQVVTKGDSGTYLMSQDFYIMAQADGPATISPSQIKINTNAIGARTYPRIIAAGWSCLFTSGSVTNTQYTCNRNAALPANVTDRIVLQFQPNIMQAGQSITVTSEHVYPANALAVDRNAANNIGTATRRIIGRRTMDETVPVTPLPIIKPKPMVVPINKLPTAARKKALH
jgi:uncharacterized protein